MTEWKLSLEEAYRIAAKTASKASQRAKDRYDKKPQSAALVKGDRVLVRNLLERGGPGKLRSYWESEVHTVLRRIGDSPVYEVQAEDNRGRLRRLHRNLLLPCNDLPVIVKPQPGKRRPRRKVVQRRPSSDSSDSDECWGHQSEAHRLDPTAKEFVPITRQETTPDSSSQSPVSTGSSQDEDRDLPTGRPARTSRPPRILTYDKPGEPTIRAVQNSISSYLHPIYV